MTHPYLPQHSRSETSDNRLSSARAAAVIYCRVSTAKQIAEGDGLAGQETSCRNYAAARGYDVLAVFSDGVTGGTDNRKALHALLDFLKLQPPGVVVLIDDLKRFAREVEVHFALKRAISETGARLESPLFRFDDSPEGKFTETLMAAQAELERNQNKRQVFRRMHARLEMGFWVFNTSPGYTYRRHPLAKKILVPDENAPLVSEALEGFASGRFPAVADVDRFLLSRGFFGQKTSSQGSRHTRVRKMLTNVLYAGWIEFPPWGVTLRKGKHEALIRYETHERICQRLKRPAALRTEAAKRHVYPLRGIVVCEGCSRRLTASRSRGESGRRYDYYHCPNRECPVYGKSIPRAEMEGEFTGLLKPLAISGERFDAFASWLTRHAVEVDQARLAARERLTEEIEAIDTRLNDLIQTISLARSETVIRSLEEKIDGLTGERGKILAKIEESGSGPAMDVGTVLERVEDLLRNPLLVWETGDAKTRHLVARVAFSEPLVYRRQIGFGTARLSLPYLVSVGMSMVDCFLVDPERIFSNSGAKKSPYSTSSAKPLNSEAICTFEVVKELQHWDQLLTDL